MTLFKHFRKKTNPAAEHMGNTAAMSQVRSIISTLRQTNTPEKDIQEKVRSFWKKETQMRK